MRVLCITDWVVPVGARWFWDYLPECSDQVDFVSIKPPADRWAKWGKVFTYYPSYLRLAWQAQKRTREVDYDAVLAFEGKDGLPLGFLRRLSGRSRAKLVILFFSVKGVIMHCLPLARYAMQGVDHIIVPTHAEAPYYKRVLGYSEQQMTFCPVGTYNIGGVGPAEPSEAGSYIFAGGRSERDYGTLVRAVDGLDARVVVNARRFNLRGMRVPVNVQVNDIMPMQDFARIVAGAQFVVAPIRNTPHAAGLTQIVYAMSAGKAVIAPRTPGIVDYVQEGRTGLLYEPGSAADLRQQIVRLLDDPAAAARMGAAARTEYLVAHTFPLMASRIRATLARVTGEEGTVSAAG